jgi:hypothetical protein
MGVFEIEFKVQSFQLWIKGLWKLFSNSYIEFE